MRHYRAGGVLQMDLCLHRHGGCWGSLSRGPECCGCSVYFECCRVRALPRRSRQRRGRDEGPASFPPRRRFCLAWVERRLTECASCFGEKYRQKLHGSFFKGEGRALPRRKVDQLKAQVTLYLTRLCFPLLFFPGAKLELNRGGYPIYSFAAGSLIYKVKI